MNKASVSFAGRVAGITIVLAIVQTSTGSDWPNFRGPNHDGISRDTEFRTSWPNPPKVVWERELGEAFSSFAYVGGRLYTCGATNKQQVLYCLDSVTGAVVWETPIEREITDPSKDLYGTRATPTVHEERVYLTGGYGRLVCLRADNGEVVWERQLKGKPNWGYAGSVLIEGNLAIVEAGKPDGSLLALSSKDGTEVWKCGDAPAGYATPYPFTFNGRRYVCGFMGDCFLVADAETGRQQVRVDWPSHSGVNASSPIFHDGYLFVSTGYGYGCGLFKLAPDGDKLKAEAVWQSKVLKNKFQTPVLHDGHLYASDERALKCVEFLTGESQWIKGDMLLDKGYKDGTLFIAEGWIFFLSESGDLFLAKATPGKFRPSARAKILDGRCWTVPILIDGRLYARSLRKAVCLDLRK